MVQTKEMSNINITNDFQMILIEIAGFYQDWMEISIHFFYT